MTRLMLDGINSDAAAASAAMTARPGEFSLIAGYVDGLYRWSAADWARFPNSTHVRIAVFASTDDGHVLDCEPGNCTPAQSVDWVLLRRKAGIDPTVYCGRNTWWGEIQAAFKARGVPQPHYWVADYGGDPSRPVIPGGALALQYADAGPYDLSAVADYWPGVDPGPQPASTATTVHTISRRDNDMHVDLQPNKTVVFTNPAAVLGGTSHLLLACDFGDATVRVAAYSFKDRGWSVTSHPVSSTGGAFAMDLPPDTNKVSVTLTAGTCPVGLDVLA
jgi:hypothetical protein